MGRYDDIFAQSHETFRAPEKKKKEDEANAAFDPQSVCEDAIAIAADFSYPFNGTETDITNLEIILKRLHVDFQNGNMEEPKLTNASIIFGVYLGQLLLNLYLEKAGFSWDVSSGMPIVRKNENNSLSPVSKVRKHIINGDEDDITPFCQVAKMIGEGTFKPQAAE